MKLPLFQVNTPTDYTRFFVDENWVDFLLGHINPLFSLTRTKARVVQIVEETVSTKTFFLRLNSKLPVFLPGQHVLVTFPVRGKLISRYYSITSTPKDKLLSLTIKRQPGGLFSNFLHDNLKIGSILELGKPEGNFVLPEKNNEKLLFVAGGSGITPFYSMLSQIQKSGETRNITLLYYSTSAQEIIFLKNLLEIKKEVFGLNIHFILTEEKNDKFSYGFLSKDQLEILVPDYKDRKVFLCGPKGLQDSLEKLIPKSQIEKEIFTPISTQGLENKEVQLELLKSGKTISLKGDKPLLDELEENGIYPLHGCRMGVCHTCACKKESGVTRNLSSGEVSDASQDTIQLCITRAESNLKLNL